MPQRILITPRAFPKNGEAQALLEAEDFELVFRLATDTYSSADLAALFPDIDGVILGVDQCDAAALAHTNKLKVISRFGVGYDAVDVQTASEKGIVVARAAGGNSAAVAELTLAYIFALSRSLINVAVASKQNNFIRPKGWELSQKTLGLIGYGNISKLVAQKANALGMNVIIYSRYPQMLTEARFCSLDELLESSDVVSLHCALSPETKTLLNKTRLIQMKQGSYLINTARGALVDENALYQALKSGHLAGAAMDAFIQEPPINNPLLELENFIATDHIGAHTQEAVDKVALIATQNLISIMKNEACPNIVNPHVYKENA